MNKIIDVTNDDLDGDEVSDNDGDASNDVIEPVMLPTSHAPISHAPVAGHAHGNKTPEKSNSFQRRKNVSNDVTEPVTIPTSHATVPGHAPIAGHTPAASHAHGSKTPEKSNSFRRRKNVSCSTQNAVQVKFGFSEKAKKNLKKNLTLVLKLLCKSFVKTILLD